MGAEGFSGFEQVIQEKICSTRRTRVEADKNQEKLFVDVTVAMQAIRYPTDLSRLNEVRKISEKLIDERYALSG